MLFTLTIKDLIGVPEWYVKLLVELGKKSRKPWYLLDIKQSELFFQTYILLTKSH